MRVINNAVNLFLALLVLCFLVYSLTWGAAYAADATVTWTNATQRVDGTAIAAGELVETQIDYAKCAVGNTFPITAEGTKVVAFPGTNATIALSGYGTWCFRARHKDSGGLFSDYAGPVWKAYVAPPKPPTVLTVAGIVWEMRMHPVDGPYLARVIGTVPAGKQCLGLAPQIGHDIFAIDAADANLTRKPNPNAMVVAQCQIIES